MPDDPIRIADLSSEDLRRWRNAIERKLDLVPQGDPRRTALRTTLAEIRQVQQSRRGYG